MMAPLPYCFSIWLRASPRARCFSSFLLLTVNCAILSPTAHVYGQWLIADRPLISLAALHPRPRPAWGCREFFIFCRVERSSRVVLQDHVQRLGHRPYPTEFHVDTACRRLTIGLWQQTATKPQLCGFAQAHLHLPHRPH